VNGRLPVDIAVRESWNRCVHAIGLVSVLVLKTSQFLLAHSGQPDMASSKVLLMCSGLFVGTAVCGLLPLLLTSDSKGQQWNGEWVCRLYLL
jgi:hypothetical protein